MCVRDRDRDRDRGEQKCRDIDRQTDKVARG